MRIPIQRLAFLSDLLDTQIFEHLQRDARQEEGK